MVSSPPSSPGPASEACVARSDTQSVWMVWQPPEEPNGIALGKEAAVIKEIVAQREIAIALISSVLVTCQRG